MIADESYIAQILETLNKEFYNTEIAQRNFLGEPYLYIKTYHNKKAVIFDISVSSYKKYGITTEQIKKEWCRAWGTW